MDDTKGQRGIHSFYSLQCNVVKIVGTNLLSDSEHGMSDSESSDFIKFRQLPIKTNN